jgi:Mg2+ and Co2+ transporter CorA
MFSGIGISELTQMVFSVGVSWYLLIVFSRKLDALSNALKELDHSIQKTQQESRAETNNIKDMFVEIKGLIKETSILVQTTSENVKVQSALTKHTIDRLNKEAEEERDK